MPEAGGTAVGLGAPPGRHELTGVESLVADVATS